MHNLATLVFHLYLFLGVAILQKCIHMRQCVEGNLVRVHLLLHSVSPSEGFYLLFQFHYAHRTAAGHGLIS